MCKKVLPFSDSAKKEKNNGLVNHGNTCYVAAAVQSMLALPNVRREAKTGPLKLLDKAIFTKDIHQSIQNGLTVQGFGDLLAELNNVADEFGNKYKHFLPFEQNDSFQLVQQIFQVKKYSKIKDLFSFDTYDELACDRCSASRKLEPKINMEVIISPNKRIQNALEAYFSCPEIIECDCTDCGSKIMRKSTHLLNPPECLLIVTQSFDVTGRKQPTLEHAEPYSEVVALPHKSENAIYELKSMVVHSGLSNTSGHFIANIKNGDVWLRADDDKVTAGSEPEIRSGETVYMQLFQKISGF